MAVAVAATATFCGCASTEAPADVGLGGQWQLDAASSDNVETQVSQAVDKAEARQRKRLNAMAMASGRGRGGLGTDQTGQLPMPYVGPDFRQLRQHLLQMLAAPPSLRMDVQEETVTIENDHLPGRDYQPGERFVRFDEYGNATVSCGWSGRAFVVRERYTSHAGLTERYEVDPKSGTLTYTRELKDPTVGNIELKSIYHHA
jgi:hypothetical protein